MSKSKCMQKKYRTRYEIQENMIFTDYSSASIENTNLTTHSSNELEILHVSRFPSDLVHRHIVKSFTT